MFSAQKILCEQASALLSLSSNADSMLKEPMDLLYNCAGKIITCGLGKSLMALKHTTREELQKQHPGGSLGNLFV